MAAKTIQFNSSKSQKLSDSHFRMDLSPPIQIPTNATPTCQLTNFSFTHSTTNVDEKLYNNNVIKVSWKMYVTDANHNTVLKTFNRTLIVPDGNYTIPQLEIELGRLVYETRTVDDKTISDGGEGNLHSYMRGNAIAKPSSYTIKMKTTAASGATTLRLDHIDHFHSQLAVGTYVAGTGIPDDTTITSVTNVSITGQDAVTDIGISAALTAQLAAGVNVTIQAAGVQGLNSAISYGFGAFDVATPTVVNQKSVDVAATGVDLADWDNALTFDELKAIVTHSVDVPPPNDDVTKIVLDQAKRSVKPFTISHDTATNKLSLIICGIVTVYETSTMLTDLLGFDVTSWPASPPATDRAEFGSLGIWTAKNAPKLDMVRAVIVHCPSLTSNTYDTTGKYTGSQLACIPISVPQNVTQSWQAPYMAPVPCNKGSCIISSVDYFCTDQDERPCDFQGNSIQGTLVIRWDDTPTKTTTPDYY